MSTTETANSYEDVTGYNNFYEFGTDKEDPKANAQKFNPRPWTIKVEGLVKSPTTIDIDTFIKPYALEERIYRMRCVEGWSMVIPWVGFPLADVIKQLEPQPSAKFVEFTTLNDANRMPGQRYPVLQWPYVEGLRLDEAMNPLTLLVVGLYGEVLPNQNGAPIRLVIPWKYGFKGIKSIVRIRFTDKQPRGSWEVAQAREYGFYANVNPNVDHPRWSQATERRLGEFRRRKTEMFNGYGDTGRQPVCRHGSAQELLTIFGSLRTVIFAAALVPAAALVYGFFTNDLTANPIDYITDTTGYDGARRCC